MFIGIDPLKSVTARPGSAPPLEHGVQSMVLAGNSRGPNAEGGQRKVPEKWRQIPENDRGRVPDPYGSALREENGFISIPQGGKP